MKWHFVFTGIIIVALLSLTTIQGPGLWWDEAVYIGLAKNIPHGYYSLDPDLALESFRPPLFPLLLSVSTNIVILKAMAFALAVLSVFAVYKFSRHFGRGIAVMTTLFVSTSSLFVFFSTKLLTESLFILLLSLSMLLLLRWIRSGSGRELVLAGVLVGMAFLTRYLASLLILTFLIVLIMNVRKRPTGLPAFLLPFLITLTPWLVFGYYVYGNPLGAYTTNISVYAGSIPQSLLQGILDIGGALTYLTIFIIVFVVFHRKKLFTTYLPITILFLLSIITYLALPHKEPRYLLSFFPVYAVMAALGISRFPKKAATVVVLLLAITTLFWGLQAAWEDREASALVDASLYLKTQPGPILTQSSPFVYALSEKKAIPYCDFVSQKDFDACQAKILAGGFTPEIIENVLEKYPITYILSSRDEPANPEEARSYLDEHFEKIAVFAQRGDTESVVIYRIG